MAVVEIGPPPDVPGPLLYFSRHQTDLVAPPSGYPSWSAYWHAKLGVTDVLFAEPDAGVIRGRKCSIIWTRAPEDVVVCSLHFLHHDGPVVVDFTDDESAAVETLLSAWWGAIKSKFTPDISLAEFVWHEFGHGVRKPNPRVRETILSGAVPGTATGNEPLPPQVAESITLKTSRRREWGRIYLPAMRVDEVVAGRILDTTVADLRTAFGTLMDAAAGDNTPIVVWAPRHDGAALQYFKTKAGVTGSAHDNLLDEPDGSSYALTVDTVQVDDLFDVQRRRRFDRATVRDTHTIGA